MFLQREIFIRPFCTVFFMSNVFPHKKECIPTFTSFEKCWTTSLWAFLGQKWRYKVAKVFAEGFFYSCFLILFLRLNDALIVQKYSCQVSKLFDIPGVIFFQKSDGRGRSKEDFLLRSTWWVHVPKPSELLPWSTVACPRMCTRGHAIFLSARANVGKYQNQECIRTRVCNAWFLHCGALARRNFK